jgi:hypothetical protein
MIDELSDLLDAAQAAIDSPDAATLRALRTALAEFRDELRLCADERMTEGGESTLAEASETLLRVVAPRLVAEMRPA